MKNFFKKMLWWAPAILPVALVLITGFSVVSTPTASMEPTIQSGRLGDITLATRPFSDIQVGDIVMVDTSHDKNWNEAYGGADALKRVVAVSGDTISTDPNTGELLVNGEVSPSEWVGSTFPFIPGTIDCQSTPRSKQCVPEFTIPDGQLLLLGDNRAESMDSLYGCHGEENPDSCLGTFPTAGVKKRVFWH